MSTTFRQLSSESMSMDSSSSSPSKSILEQESSFLPDLNDLSNSSSIFEDLFGCGDDGDGGDGGASPNQSFASSSSSSSGSLSGFGSGSAGFNSDRYQSALSASGSSSSIFFTAVNKISLVSLERRIDFHLQRIMKANRLVNFKNSIEGLPIEERINESLLEIIVRGWMPIF